MWAWLGTLWQNALTFIAQLFAQVYSFFAGMGYLLDHVVQFAGLVIQVILLGIQILFSVMQGIISTFTSLASATPAGTPISQLQQGFSFVRGLLDPMGFQVLGYLLAFAVWAVAALAIVSLFGR